MWQLSPTDLFRTRLKRYENKHRRESIAMLDNLDTYFLTLQAGVKPL